MASFFLEKAVGSAVNYAGQKIYQRGKAYADQWVSGKIDQGLEAIGNRADTYLAGMGTPNKRHRFDSSGYSPDPEMSSWQQENSAQANKKARTVNGQASAVSLSDGVACPAMFNPGRGAELGLVNKLIDTPLRFKTGEHPGPSGPVDAFNSQLQLYRGCKMSQAFAWKGVVPVIAATSDALANRGYVHNVFRHYNYAAYGSGNTTYEFYSPSNNQWNNSLGPDSAVVRTAPIVTGTQATDLSNAGLNATLRSPYRSPTTGAIMYSRMTRQFMENSSWALHPFKFVQPEAGGTGTVLTVTNPVVYSNSGTAHYRYPTSYPAQQPYTTGTVIDGKTHGSPYYYKTQFGRGKIAYDFSNDGTSPVVIDVVINKVKQGMNWKSSPLASASNGNAALLDSVYKNGYIRMAQSNRNLVDANGMNGQVPVDTDCLTNSRVEFMPKAALKYSRNFTTDTLSSTETFAQPFKQVARDQFIISAGATRAWSFELPALDYDPRRFGNLCTAVDGSTTAIVLEDICDEYTYIVSIAYSAVSTPLFEVPTGLTAKSAIIDRRPGDCNISVTGQYEEYIHPVYLAKDTLTSAYINGALDVPYYGTAPGAGVLANLEIANLNQVTRGNTPGSALISVGAINTLPGA